METSETSLSREEQRERQLAPACAQFDLQSEGARLRGQDAFREHGQSASTLFKYADLRCVLIALRRGARIREHEAEGRLSLQCVAGRVRVHLDGRAVELTPGQLLVLERCVPHDLEALEESDIVLTLAWAGHLT
jgi:quercetin dioxygenase-like cupin family protein